MKKVLLLALNARWTHSNLAVYYIKNEIIKFDHNVYICQLSINNSLSDILKKIYDKKPDILAISVYIWNSNLTKIIISEIKKILPDIKLILGGPEVSYNPNYWLTNYSYVDLIIIGNGESSFEYLAKNDFEFSPGIMFKKAKPFAKIPFPYTDKDLLELKNKYIYYETSRGCPFKCSYCLSSREDQILQHKNPNNVFKEIEKICSYQPKIIKLVDRTFNAQKNHYRKIWKFLIEKNYATKFHFEIHPTLLDNLDFEILANVREDYFQFEIGIQSLNLDTIKAINRNDIWSKSKENIIKLLNLKKIHIHLDLIVGLPFETVDTFKQGFNNVYEIKPEMLQIGFLKVLPGTSINEQKKKYGIMHLTNAPYTVLSTNDMSFNDISDLHKFENCFEILYNSHHFDTFLDNFIAEFSSPFDMYFTLSDLFVEFESISTKKIFAILYKFVMNYKKSNFYIDCLKWDWAKFSKSHYYPEYLNSKIIRNAKEKGYQYLWEKQIFAKSDIKRAVFFSANSKEFRKKYQDGALITAFLNNKNKIINLPVVTEE